MEQASASVRSGVVVIHGDADETQRLHVSAADSPEAIEHCIRNLFQIETAFSLLLYNEDGIAMPLGAGLLSQPSATGPESTCPVFRLEVRERRPDLQQRCSDVEDLEDSFEEMKPLPSLVSNVGGAYRAGAKRTSVAHHEFSNGVIPRRVVPAPSRNMSVLSNPSNAANVGMIAGLLNPLTLSCTKEYISEGDDEDHEENPLNSSVSQSLFDSVLPLFNQPSRHDKPQMGRTSTESFPPSYVLRSSTDLEQVSRARDEVQFWCNCAEGYRKALDSKVHSAGSPGKAKPRPSVFSETPHVEEEIQVSAFDSTDARIENLYNHWKGSRPMLSIDVLQKHLWKENKLTIDQETLETALAKVYKSYNPNMSIEEIWRRSKDGTVPRNIFGGVWQRLMLGALCGRCQDGQGNVAITEPKIRLTEYNEEAFDFEVLVEEELLFRQPLRTRGRVDIHGDLVSLDHPARWVRADSASPDRLLRMGVKFFVHPLATGDAITAARTGMTKIDRYRHQYFVSLEVYSLQSQFKLTSGLSGPILAMYESKGTESGVEDKEPPRVGPSVMRSSIFLVATGSPCSGHRDWLLSFVGKPVSGIKDPLDFFTNTTEAASNVLDLVQSDLEEHGRIREYQADFLLYSILDRAAKEVSPICWAYGHRLRWMQDGLAKQKLSTPTENLDEVSKMRLEMQELKQWVGQMKGILKTLAEDCRNFRNDGESIPWNFGAHAEGRGKSLLMFLSNTDAMLEQTSDRLATLDDLARNFLDSHARLRDGFTNNILLALTISTAVYAPAQLIAGIYGTNFVDDEGTPSVPELRWRYGYPVFVSVCLGIILAGLIAAWCCLRKGAH